MSVKVIKIQFKKISESNVRSDKRLQLLLQEIHNVTYAETLKLSVHQLRFAFIKTQFINHRIKMICDSGEPFGKIPPEIWELVKELIPQPLIEIKVFTEDSNMSICNEASRQLFNDECKSFKSENEELDNEIQSISSKCSVINYQSKKGFTPLQIACQHRQADIITILIENGADLSRSCLENGKERTTMDLLICRLPGAKSLLKEIFDSTIQLKKQYCQIDYNILLPDIDGTGKYPQSMKVVDTLVQTGDKFGQQDLLVHPLVTSFLDLQWRKISVPYFFFTFLYLLFLIFLNTLVVNRFKLFWDYNEAVDIVLRVFTSLTLIVLFILEAIYLLKIRCGRNRFEFCLKLTCYILALIIVVYTNCQKQLTAFAILLSWFEVIFIVSRIPRYGYYMLMFMEVTSNYFKFILSFSFLLFGFAITFMIIFKDTKHFDETGNALTKSVAMMNSEFDHMSMFSDIHDGKTAVLFAQFVFLLFIFLVSTVLTNLLIAKAIIDSPRIRRLKQRANFISMHETMFSSIPFSKYLRDKINSLFKTLERLSPKRGFFKDWKWNAVVVLKLHIGMNEMNDQAIPFGNKLTNAILQQGEANKERKIEKYKAEEMTKLVKDQAKVPIDTKVRKKEKREKGKKPEEKGSGDK